MGCFMDNLNNLFVGEEAVIKKINLSGSIKRRLLDIGLVPGTRVKCLFFSPFNNPKAYGVRGSVIALRNDESKNIMVEKLEDYNV